MKIRTDFVSNSSSVSYIITMHKDMVKTYEQFYMNGINPEIEKIVNLLKDDLVENGTRIYMAGEEIFFKKIKFQTDGDAMDRESYEAAGKKFDFSIIPDGELWSYIYGEYVLNGKLGGIRGFGLTQVETY